MPTTALASADLTDGAINIIDLLIACKLSASKSEARRLIAQGGISVNEEKIDSIEKSFTAEELTTGLKIRKGKKVYHKAVLQ